MKRAVESADNGLLNPSRFCLLENFPRLPRHKNDLQWTNSRLAGSVSVYVSFWSSRLWSPCKGTLGPSPPEWRHLAYHFGAIRCGISEIQKVLQNGMQNADTFLTQALWRSALCEFDCSSLEPSQGGRSGLEKAN